MDFLLVINSLLLTVGNAVEWEYFLWSLEFFLSTLTEILSPDEMNRSFDKKASGFSSSESVGVFFLQKAKNLKRIYAEFNAINVEQGEHILDKNIMFNTA
ncbi:hypothetical protein M0802_012423 [Mischocyttarus mexicanus]|nr:hypothetical protein M0802_012423 [Mischocyttarus mexicanus]